MNFIKVISSETNVNGNEYYRVQCLVSGDVSPLYYTTDLEIGQTYFSASLKWVKSDQGELLQGVLLKVSEEKATDKIMDGLGKPVHNKKPVANGGTNNSGQKSFNNPKVEVTKVLLPEAEYQAKLALLGGDTAAIAEFEAKYDVQL